MLIHSRREFLKAGSASLIGGAALLETAQELQAQTLMLPLAIQLYSVRDLLPKDYLGTLKALSTLGYSEVESAGYYGHSAAEVKQAMTETHLRLVSAHHPMNDLRTKLDEILEFSHGVGVKTLVCSSPALKDPSKVKDPKDWSHAFTMDDWHWNADQLNALGDKVNAAGMKFGYHNHFIEFHQADGVVPYDELLRLTDPAKVTMEMDCGWVVVGGAKPKDYLEKYPLRITMLHVKDFRRPGSPGAAANETAGEPKPIELGRGFINYDPIFAQAVLGGKVTHVFVEQEAFTVPPTQSLKIDADYMHRLGIH